ncbi:hypothetical protein IWZ03DRAFT_202461 [Phyllosticta citriasiana]|uniref:Transposase n=1 Tax=Phyllosticta citriasiana TaxID=595635 RepID=A0ABR1KI55_9PEZI
MDFTKVVETVYSTTPPNDTGLRNFVVKMTLEDLDVLIDSVDDFREMMARVGEFGRDVALVMCETSKSRYGCSKCGAAICMKIPAQSRVFCPHCQHSRTTTRWELLRKRSPAHLSNYISPCCKGLVEMELRWYEYERSTTYCPLWHWRVDRVLENDHGERQWKERFRKLRTGTTSRGFPSYRLIALRQISTYLEGGFHLNFLFERLGKVLPAKLAGAPVYHCDS